MWCADSKQGTKQGLAKMCIILGMRRTTGGAVSGTRDPMQKGNLLESGNVSSLALKHVAADAAPAAAAAAAAAVAKLAPAVCVTAVPVT